MVSKRHLEDELQRQVFQHINLDPDALHSISTLFTERGYSQKESLLNVGDKWERLFYVHRGMIRLFYTDVEGREYNKAFFWEGHCIWPVAPRDRRDEMLFSIAALEDAIIYECSFLRLHEFLRQRGWWEKFALPYAETLVEQKFLREHDLLLLSARQRYEELIETHPIIVRRIPDYHLASFLGITNVSLSRIKRSAKS